GHQVDGAAHLGDLEQVQGHAVVVLDAVEADPRHGVVPGDVVGVVRLVLMPEESERDHGVYQMVLAGGAGEAGAERRVHCSTAMVWKDPSHCLTRGVLTLFLDCL